MKKVFLDYEDTAVLERLSSSQMLKVLQDALRLGLMASGQMTREIEEHKIQIQGENGEEDQIDIKLPLQSPPSVAAEANNTEFAKRVSFPQCYVNLLANRGTVTASSPGQPNLMGELLPLPPSIKI